jgi:CBS domain-containing protein
MKISDILRHKHDINNAAVITIAPDGTVIELLASLAKHRIGALVVVDAGAVVGIVSERDVVRRLNERGSGVLTGTVAQIMTTTVVSCSPDDSVDSVATTMTDRRIRHMPVLDRGTLSGIVTIGDVVFSRISQLEHDRGQLEQYITGRTG